MFNASAVCGHLLHQSVTIRTYPEMSNSGKKSHEAVTLIKVKAYCEYRHYGIMHLMAKNYVVI